MKKRIILLGLVTTMFLIMNVSAGVYFSQPESTYNLGDMIEIEANVDPIVEGRLLEIELVCAGDSVLQFNRFPEEGNVNIKLPLSFYTINEVSGKCYFQANYGDESGIKSNEFEISKRLEVSISSESFFTKPGEEITISGSASRLNEVGINGEVEISIPLLNLLEQGKELKEEMNDEEIVEEDVEEEDSKDENEVTEEEDNEEVESLIESNSDAGKFYGRVSEGQFSVSFQLAKDTPAGDYRIDVLAYEKLGDKKTSEGFAIANLKVFQILTKADVAFNNQNLDPGENFEFKPLLMDQTDAPIYEEVTVIIRDENSNRIFEKIVESDQTITYSLLSNLTAGYYEIEVSSGEISSKKKLYVNEKEIISYEVNNETLTITNIGNVPYNKDVQIELNGKPFVKSLELELSEIQEFKLTGSNEEYNIKVSDGDTEIIENGVLLTGHAVGVDSIKESGSFSLVPVIWIFLILIIIGGILFLLRNVFKKKSFAYPFKDKFKFRKKSEVVPNKIEALENKEIKKETAADRIVKKQTQIVIPSQAEQVLVLKGHKNKVAIIVLKIKNKINESSKQSLEKAIKYVYEKKGVVYEQGDYVFLIFSPLITRGFKNEVEAAKVAEKIKLILKEHNKKMADKIDFGISINSGEMINKIEDGKLKFTALGNLIVSGKRLAEASDEQILVTQESYERGISDHSCEKRKVKGAEVYEIKKIMNLEKNKEFIQGFLERQKRQK